MRSATHCVSRTKKFHELVRAPCGQSGGAGAVLETQEPCRRRRTSVGDAGAVSTTPVDTGSHCLAARVTVCGRRHRARSSLVSHAAFSPLTAAHHRQLIKVAGVSARDTRRPDGLGRALVARSALQRAGGSAYNLKPSSVTVTCGGSGAQCIKFFTALGEER